MIYAAARREKLKPRRRENMERFFQTFELFDARFNDIIGFLEHYNHVRPCRSLDFSALTEAYHA